MRNLKRALSMALAAVMLLGMMVIGASASYSDFTDQGEIEHKEAVALLTDLGVISGKTPTSYDPDGTIERAALSKMIYFVMMGGTDATPYEGMDIFGDVSGNWAEGYINYCASVGIFGGVGKDASGKDLFNPYGTLTVAQAAKGLLVALGYVAEDRGYNGATWTIGVISDAQTNGLLEGISQGVNEAITRDNAAQMIFNALNAKMVEAKYQYDMGNQYVSEYKDLGKTLGQMKFDLVKITATVEKLDAKGNAVLSNVTPDAGMASGTIPATPDMVGTNVVLYGRKNAGGTVASIYSTVLLPGATKVLGISTNGTKISSLIDEKNPNYISGLDTGAQYIVNGADPVSETPYANTIKVGTIVEFIDTDANGKANIVRVTTKTVDEVTGAVTTRTGTDGIVEVRIPGVVNTYTDVTKVAGYEGLKEGDVVLTLSSKGVTTIEKAASITGVVSSSNSDGTVTINGVKYATSTLTGASFSMTNDNYVNAYTYYLDNGSNIVKAVPTTETTETVNYAVLLKGAWVDGTGAIGESQYAQAQLLLADGTTTIVTVSKVGDAKPEDEEDVTGVESANIGKFFTYTVASNGSYELKLVESEDLATVSGTVTPGQPKFSGGDAVGNAATVFIVKTGNSYNLYSGIANVPAGTVKSGTAVKNESGVVTYVYMELTPAATEGKTLVYVTSTDYGTRYDADAKTAYYVYDVIVDGEATTIEAKDSTTFTSKGLWSCATEDGIVVSEGTSAVSDTKAATIVGGGVLKLNGDDKYYTYDDATMVYIFNGDNNTLELVGDGSDLAAAPDGYTDSYYVVPVAGDANNLLDAVYVIRTVE